MRWFSREVGRKVQVIVLAMRLASSGGGVVIFILLSAFSSLRGGLVRAVLASNVRRGLGGWVRHGVYALQETPSPSSSGGDS
jgi:hypothetical protein